MHAHYVSGLIFFAAFTHPVSSRTKMTPTVLPIIYHASPAPHFLRANNFTQINDIPAKIVVESSDSTSAVKTNADDCAIWLHPADPTKSVLIGTDKGDPDGGLFVWNLQGKQIQHIQLPKPNNVDIRCGMSLNGLAIDIAVVNIRHPQQLKVFLINPVTGTLEDITTKDGIKTPELDDPYGLCLYRRPTDGAMFVIESTKSENTANLHQYRLQDDGTGKVKGTYVRAFGNNSIESIVEGLVADDELGYVYAADEHRAVRKYYADPDLHHNEQIVAFATDDGITGDREGLALYKLTDGTGYLLLSSQGDNTLKVYRREGDAGNPHKHGLVTTIKTKGSIETDGLEVTSQSAPPNFSQGLLVKHNSPGRNFIFYGWEDVAQTHLKIYARDQVK